MNFEMVLISIIIIPLIGSFIGYLIGIKKEKTRDIFNVLMTSANFILITSLYNTVANNEIRFTLPNFMGFGLSLSLDMFQYVFTWLTSLIWFLITVYSIRYMSGYDKKNRFFFFLMLTYSSTLGIFLSHNLITLFIFFEIMSLTSYPIIIHDEDDFAQEAGQTYLVMAVGGGLVLLMGLFLLYSYTNTFEMEEIKIALQNLEKIKYVIISFIIFGFGVKAGMVPIHIWLPKAHPAAPAPASAILSGVLLKTGIFGIFVTVNLFPEDMYISTTLLILGFLTMFLGGFFALFQKNIKTTLAYSSMSQMGYIIVSIGLIGILGKHKDIAVYGFLLHVINHMIFKILLFIGAGIIYMNIHKLNLDDIRGYGKDKILFKLFFFIGACGLMGIPGFNGFISKNIIHEALAEAVHLHGGFWLYFGEIIFVLSSAFTVTYMLNLFVEIFIEKPVITEHYESDRMGITLAAMGVLAVMVIFTGVYPQSIMNITYTAVSYFDFHPIEMKFYSAEPLKSSLISFILGTAIYILIKKISRSHKGIKVRQFNLEKNVYKPIFKLLFIVSTLIFEFCDKGLEKMVELIGRAIHSFFNIFVFNHENIGLDTELNRVNNKITSITYSVYIFGLTLLISLVILIF